MRDNIRVLIADAYPIVRWAVRSFLERETGVDVVGEASSVAEATRLIRSMKPDLVITEINFPNTSTADTLTELVRNKELRALAFTENDSWRDVEEFTSAGGLGFVSKKSPLNDLINAIRAVSANRQWISPLIRETNIDTEAEDPDDLSLSRREREIVGLVANGLTSKQIADKLCLSLRTVENHRHRVFKKLGIQRSAQLVDYAIKNGLRGDLKTKASI